MSSKRTSGAVKPRERHRHVLEKRVHACDNLLFNIYFDCISSPAGERVERFLVVSPKHRSRAGITGVAVLPVVDGRFGLLRLYRHPVASDVWEVPRGFVDAGESAATAALRELEEETGLSCRNSKLIPLGKIFPEAGILSAQVALFAAEVAPGKRVGVSAEFGHREFRLMTRREFERKIENGDIKDPTSLVAYYKYVGKFLGRARRNTTGQGSQATRKVTRKTRKGAR